MHDRTQRLVWLFVLAIALGALFLYRPVVISLGYDLDNVVPPWADFLTPGQYREFHGRVEGYFRENGVEVRIENGTAYTGEGAAYVLRTLAQQCRQKDRRAWRSIVRDYFHALRGKAEEKPVPAGLPKSRKRTRE